MKVIRFFIWFIVLVIALTIDYSPALAASPAAPTDLQVGGWPGGQIRLVWSDTSANETGFRIERSSKDRNNFSFLATVGANTTSYVDPSVALNVTYWYRVQACNSDGCSAYSKDSYNVSFATGSVPNLDERYMLFLVNETRSDPAAYGYPAYEPRSPVIYNELLNVAAHSHSQAILNSNFTIGHCYPDPANATTERRCPTERARDVGYIGGVTENLVAGNDGWAAVEAAHQGFLGSVGHRENILDINAKEAGMGHTYAPGQALISPGQYTHTFCGTNPVPIDALPSGIVVPYWGRATTQFTFLVNFFSGGGTGPTQAQVVIDGIGYEMQPRHGTAANGSYAYTTQLPAGNHTYYFDFNYGSGHSARLPVSGSYSGPDVEVDGAMLEVPTEYSTLAEALAYARGDVVIQLAEGTFNENTPLIIPTTGTTIQGAGFDKTTVQGDGEGHVLEAHVDAQIRNLTISGSGTGYFEAGLWHTAGHVDVRNVRFTGNNVGIFSWCHSTDCTAEATVVGAIFDHNLRAAVDANDGPVHRLTNVTVVENNHGIILNNGASLVQNSIIAANTGDGLSGHNKLPTSRYNDVWGNGLNYKEMVAGPEDLSEEPMFASEAPVDYLLAVGSPCIDRGNPEQTYNDRNGSRNDLGAYGGPLALKALNSRAISPAQTQESFNVNWEGYATDGFKGFDVQYRVGALGIWQDWLVNTISTSAQFGPTVPVSLTLNTTYYFRSRIKDELGAIEAYPLVPDAVTRFGDTINIYLPVILK